MKSVFSALLDAYNLRFARFGNFVSTCAIMNAKSGRCWSDCKFCAQSAYYSTSVREYPLLPMDVLIKNALDMFKKGVDRFSLVTSGVTISDDELEVIGNAVRTLSDIGMKVCASLGVMDVDRLSFLKECGLWRYHHNIETSERFYREISSVQKWSDRVRTVRFAKEVGLSVCSGCLFGMGESDEDVMFMVHTLKDLDVDAVPVNFLHPIAGTPLEGADFLTPLKCLEILSTLRLNMPDKEIIVCGGREYNLRDLQALALMPASGIMVGNYLTTRGRNITDDAKMIKDMGMSSNLVC